MRPVILINFKTYKFGRDVLKWARAFESVDPRIILAVQPQDVHVLFSSVKNPLFVQHVDFCVPGRNTGFLTPEGLYAVGATGVLLNHSEHPLSLPVIRKTVKRCKDVGLQVALFAKDFRQAKLFTKLAPDYLIVEPPELVSKKSISKADPQLIERLALRLRYPFLVGAGIRDRDDVRIAAERGASGVALSSSLMTAQNPKKALKDLFGYR